MLEAWTSYRRKECMRHWGEALARSHRATLERRPQPSQEVEPEEKQSA